MRKETLNFTGMFSHYTPIDLEPYYVFTNYVFTTKQKFLIKCIDYPKLIGEGSKFHAHSKRGNQFRN